MEGLKTMRGGGSDGKLGAVTISMPHGSEVNTGIPVKTEGVQLVCVLITYGNTKYHSISLFVNGSSVRGSIDSSVKFIVDDGYFYVRQTLGMTHTGIFYFAEA